MRGSSYLLTARLVAYRFLGYVLVLLQRCTRIYVQQCSCTVFFVSAIETLIVVVCHVLFVTTVGISENELRESINIYSSRAEVQQKSSYLPTI